MAEKISNTQDVEGELLYYTTPDGKQHLIFRIYDQIDPKKSKDYEVRLHDLRIKILNRNVMVESEEGNYLEYIHVHRRRADLP